jgi:hypothetical protein
VDIIQSFKLIYDPELHKVTPRQRWIEQIENDFAKKSQDAVQSVASEKNGHKKKHFSKSKIAKLHHWLDAQADGTNLAKTDHAGIENDESSQNAPFEDPTLSCKNCKFYVNKCAHLNCLRGLKYYEKS